MVALLGTAHEPSHRVSLSHLCPEAKLKGGLSGYTETPKVGKCFRAGHVKEHEPLVWYSETPTVRGLSSQWMECS